MNLSSLSRRFADRLVPTLSGLLFAAALPLCAQAQEVGVDLQVKVYTDYVQPNLVVDERQLDASNSGRALSLLAQQGLIKLKDPASIRATARDVVDNPRKLQFRELEAAQLPRALPDVDLALINTNYALEAKLNPAKDALFLESGLNSAYANFIAARADNADSPAIRKLVAALHSPEVKQFIQDKYQGAVSPAF